VSVSLITSAVGFEDLLSTLAAADRYALDTEFHRERTYFPRLALMQFAWAGGTALVDPLAVDVSPLRRVLEGTGLAVLHAAQQDLDVLMAACGTIPRRLYDTQVAAGFIGYSSPSLSSLVHGELGIGLPKGDRLTDWLRRPLTDSQLGYAASDVAHLLDLHDRIVGKLRARGRDAWAEEACEELRTRPVGGAEPAQAWLRLKDARTLRSGARGVAAAVAEWRERRAMTLDVPVRQVLADLAILGIAQRAPRTPEELRQARGVEERHLRGAVVSEILAAVRRGLEHPVELPSGTRDELDRTMRPAVTLASAWVSEVARREALDTTLLGTRADIVGFLSGTDGSRLASGWRYDLVGRDLEALAAGRAALAFEPDGGLRLLPR
jgi:ribonuclease D